MGGLEPWRLIHKMEEEQSPGRLLVSGSGETTR